MKFFTLRSIIHSAFPFLAVSVLISSCDKFEGDQTVPAYIKIDSIGLKVTAASQGSNSSEIADAWIFVDDQLVGAFELPCVIPVLSQGLCKVTVKPGIRLNGMINLRSAFPLFTSFTQNLVLTPDSVTTVTGTLINGKHTPMVSYSENTVFAVGEAFEDEALIFDTASNSQVKMGLTPAGSPLTFEGDHAGVVSLTDTLTYFEMFTHEKYPLPRLGTAVFLEMNYKTTLPFAVGVYAYSTSGIIQQPILVLSEMPEWRKIYVNLSPFVSSQTSATNFRIFIGASRSATAAEGTLYLDNIKLIHL